MKYIVRAQMSLIGILLSIAALGWSWEISPAASPRYWGYCRDTLAFADRNLTQRRPEADWVCKAPTAAATGDAVEPNSLRCANGQRRECEMDAGGLPGPGDHNVPREAWYWIPGTSAKYPDVRCQCGCFTAEVRIQTSLGERPIADLARLASHEGGVQAVTLDAQGAQTLSRSLFNRDFIVGPEQRPVYRLIFEDATELRLTEKHPVLVQRAGYRVMVQARELQAGDRLWRDNGSIIGLEKIQRQILPANERRVFNFDAKADDKSEHAAHIIIANGIQVGDLHWQRKLSEEAARIANVTRYTLGQSNH